MNNINFNYDEYYFDDYPHDHEEIKIIDHIFVLENFSKTCKICNVTWEDYFDIPKDKISCKEQLIKNLIE